jgi:S-adenosylmethionine:tRNA ribosyltransferase-isomerase
VTQTVNRLHDLDQYDYVLPKELIAQEPVTPRDASRLLLVSRTARFLRDHPFSDLPSLLQPGDLLVLNDTRVFPARLLCDRGELLLVRRVDEDNSWDALVYPGRAFKPGTRFDLPDGESGMVLCQSTIGRILRFSCDIGPLLDKHGKVPLPPYVEREEKRSDRSRYQTVYARKTGSVAAPTAGLHFTPRLLRQLKEHGIGTAKITLHVGPGTFRPVKSRDVTQHRVDPEYYRCSKATWDRIRCARRVIAVGTTTTRALETIAAGGELEGFTPLFIYPGYSFRSVQGLITNFHLPKSSLLMLVSAFADHSLIRQAYTHAVDRKYRFYSYGDAMLIL